MIQFTCLNRFFPWVGRGKEWRHQVSLGPRLVEAISSRTWQSYGRARSVWPSYGLLSGRTQPLERGLIFWLLPGWMSCQGQSENTTTRNQSVQALGLPTREGLQISYAKNRGTLYFTFPVTIHSLGWSHPHLGISLL